jgi:propionyl-CoA carboxylase beta chain
VALDVVGDELRAALSNQLRRRRELVSDGVRVEAVDRQHGLNKLTARERIALLVDRDGFREFGALSDAKGVTEVMTFTAPADGVVTGVGYIDGRPAVVMANDFTVFGGSDGSVGHSKFARCCERALRDGIPLVMLFDGGGHRIQEGLDSRHFARGFTGFQDLVNLSGYVPVVAVMMGPGFAGPSNFAALADFVVMVRGISTMGIAGPALVRAATGENLSKEELGGADGQAALGVTDLAVDSEAEALDAVRLFLSYLPSNCAGVPPADDPDDVVEPGLDIEELVPANLRQSYDVRPVLDALADADSVFEIKPRFAPNVVTALARIGGRPVGIVANQAAHLSGSLDSPACEKAAHFVSLCDAYGVALLFLIDVPGFLVGMESARTQLARRSGRMLFELGQATVPRLSVVLRKGYGAGYIAMGGGRSFSADLALAWPTAEICAMAVEGAVDVAYRRDIEAAEDSDARRSELIDGFRSGINAFAAAQGFGIDDVVLPSETRSALVHYLGRAPARHSKTVPFRHHGISPI